MTTLDVTLSYGCYNKMIITAVITKRDVNSIYIMLAEYKAFSD